MVSIPIMAAFAFATLTFAIELHRGVDDQMERVAALSSLGAIAFILIGEFGPIDGIIPILIAGALVIVSIGTITASVVSSPFRS